MENSACAKVTLFILTFFVIGVFKYCMFLQSLNANGNAPLKFINVLIFEFLLNFLFSVLLFFSQRSCYDFITDYFFKTVIVNYLSIMIANKKQRTTIFTAFFQIMLRE